MGYVAARYRWYIVKSMSQTKTKFLATPLPLFFSAPRLALGTPVYNIVSTGNLDAVLLVRLRTRRLLLWQYHAINRASTTTVTSSVQPLAMLRVYSFTGRIMMEGVNWRHETDSKRRRAVSKTQAQEQVTWSDARYRGAGSP